MKKNYGHLRPGDPCPKCTKGVKKSLRKVSVDADGETKHIHSKPIKLQKCGCKGDGHCNHAYCSKCSWTNF